MGYSSVIVNGLDLFFSQLMIIIQSLRDKQWFGMIVCYDIYSQYIFIFFINLMFVSPTNTKRFTLYHMEENQVYIQDFYGSCSFFDFNSNQDKINDKGKFYLCSKTIVFQSNNKNIPLSKYRFESFKTLPTFSSESIKFNISRITTIRAIGNNPPEPFRIYQDVNQKIQIKPSYENVRNLQEWIIMLFESSRKKNNYDMEERVYEWIINKFNKKAFNMSLIDSVSEKPMIEENNILARRVLPLNHICGYIFITNQKVYFEPFHNLSGNTVDKIQIEQIEKLFKRRYELRQIGLEIITSRSYYFTFENQNYRNRIYSCLSKRVSENCVKINQLENITLKWQTREINNYQYLMLLNQAGNRSFSDLSQYPVFPWVLMDYQSQQIDLSDEKVYRNLSKPIGAINENRLQSLMMRYQSMQPPKFIYGVHYSTPGYVIGYLVRKKPQYMLKLQSGRFDKPDRLFKSIKDDWHNVMQNPTSLKQLIPEFYQDDINFLQNYQNLDLGIRQNKKRVHDVKLPKWAHKNPNSFLKIMKQALQSEYVSNNLHHWIDLIFGYKQRGQQAIKAHNLFHHLTYQGMIDMESIKDPIQKIALKCQINEFGQCPKQIFKIPHPSRNSVQPIYSQNLLNSLSNGEESDNEQNNEGQDPFISPPVKINSVKNIETSGMYSNNIPKVKTVVSLGKQSDIKLTEISKAHKNEIMRAIHLKSKPNSLLTIGQDGFLKIFDVYEKNCKKSFKICDFCLSSIAVLKNDEVFAIGSWDNSIYIFNIVYGSKSKPFPAHDNSINDLVYMPKRKKLVSGSWDCSVKMFRFVGNIIDNEQHFYDHQNQVSCLGANDDENILALGDIEGNVICISIDEQQKLFTLNMNSQKLSKIEFLQNNLVVAAETQFRLLDLNGTLLTSYSTQKNNGLISDIHLDGQHLFIITTKKQLILFDILQQKKIGNYFNDFVFSTQDKLPNDKSLNVVTSGNDGLFVACGSNNGNIYILRP